MYHKTNYEKEKKIAPFLVECTNCGSHNVTVTACEYLDLEIKCNRCGSYLDCGRYNETTYKGE